MASERIPAGAPAGGRLRKKRPRRIPSAAVRRIQSPKLPRGVELFYLLVLSRRANAFATIVSSVLTPARIAKFAAPPVKHTDAEEEEEAEEEEAEEALAEAASEEAARVLTELREKTRALESDKFLIDTNTAAKRVVKHSKSEFDRLGIKLLDGDPDFSDMVDEWRAGCVARITSVEDDQLDKIESLLKEGFGHRVETLQDRIQEQVEDVPASRAEFIARDQVLSLNAKVTQHMHAAAGIESYIWSTSDDERVRPSHEALEGQEFRWDDPPEINDDGDTGHPGDDFLCRCVPYPVLPELDEDDQGEDAPADDDEEEPEDDE